MARTTPASTRSSKKGNANTIATPYLDTFNKYPKCKEDNERIEKSCQPEDQEKKEQRLKKSGKNSQKLLSKLTLNKHKPKLPARNRTASWIKDHCEFLMHKPGDPEGLIDELTKLPEEIAKAAGKTVQEKILAEAQQKLEREIEERVAKIMLKKGAVKVAGRALSLLTGPFAIVINVAMTAYDVYDAAATYEEVANEYREKFKAIKDVKDKIAKIDQQIKEVKDLLNNSDYINQDGSYSPDKMVSDVMYAAAESNDCIRARRCKLVPFQNVEHKNGSGCCPGQTGHHVLPSSMFSDCPAYTKDVENAAPTICVEGASNWAGSHKRIHDKMHDRLGQLTDKSNNPIPRGSEIGKKEAIEEGAGSVKDQFPGCNEACIKAQLNSFYKKLRCTPKSNSGASGSKTSTTTGAGK